MIQSLNQQYGGQLAKIIPAKPDFNQDRIDGLINLACSKERYADVKDQAEESLVNFSQAIHADMVEKNAKLNSQMGFKPKIVRKTAGHCCDWCGSMAGTYDYYPDMDRDVFRRHARCRCTVEYVPDKSGRVQDVWSKEWVNPPSTRIARPMRFTLDIQLFGGKERAHKHSKNWKNVSLTETVKNLIPDAAVEERPLKRLYKSDNSTFMIIEDKEGNYFRIIDNSITDLGKFKYVTCTGEDVRFKLVD